MADMKQKLQILNLEDNENDTELIHVTLEDEGIACDITRVETEAGFIAAIEQGGFDLFLVDYTLPSFDGMSTLAIARVRCPDIPFIFVSGSIGEDMAIEALKNGSTDYVLKDKLARLAPSVLRALREAEERIDRKKIEEALLRSEERYRNVFDTMQDGIYRTDRDGVFVLMNPAGAQMFGHRSPEEMIGIKALDYWLDPADREVFQKELREKKSLKAYHIRARKITGEDLHLETSSIILEDNNGNLIGIEGILRDITERLKLEDQLRQAQKMEAIGTFAGGIAHDFNNILNVIIGYGTMVLDRIGDDQFSREQMNEVLTAADRAAHLTKDLLLFSRKQVGELKPVDLNEVVRKVEKFLLRVIGEDIECKTVFYDQPLTVLADSHQLEQVLMNFATNARDAMPKGGAFTVTIEQVNLNEDFTSAHSYGNPGTYALITVSDTGMGMNEETRQRIFEPFFTTKEVGKGTGLGLAVVFGIIKQHEGHINVYSEPGKGTTFRIYLPAIVSAIREEDKTLKEAPAHGTETILLAEDNEQLRRLYGTILQEFGYSVIEAVDGEDAVKKFMENRDSIHILLLDLIMPKMNGKEAYVEIRKIWPDMKVIFSSGYAPDMIRQKVSLETGANLIYKPVSPFELLRMVRSVLDGK